MKSSFFVFVGWYSYTDNTANVRQGVSSLLCRYIAGITLLILEPRPSGQLKLFKIVPYNFIAPAGELLFSTAKKVTKKAALTLFALRVPVYCKC